MDNAQAALLKFFVMSSFLGGFRSRIRQFRFLEITCLPSPWLGFETGYQYPDESSLSAPRIGKRRMACEATGPLGQAGDKNAEMAERVRVVLHFALMRQLQFAVEISDRVLDHLELDRAGRIVAVLILYDKCESLLLVIAGFLRFISHKLA